MSPLSLLNLIHTKLLVGFLRLCGRDITIGKGTIIACGAKVIVGGGKIVLGPKCYIETGAVLNAYHGEIICGHHVSVNYHSVLYGHGGLHIGNDCRIAAHVVIIPAEHNFRDAGTLIRKQGVTQKGITVGNDVWLGAGSVVLDGAHIADGCVIGANSTVKGQTEAYTVYVGSPAKAASRRDYEGEKA